VKTGRRRRGRIFCFDKFSDIPDLIIERRKDIWPHGLQELEIPVTNLDTSQTDCPFCGDHIEGRIIKEFGLAIQRIRGVGSGESFRIRWHIENVGVHAQAIPRISDGKDAS
jgi:hypothetical protein